MAERIVPCFEPEEPLKEVLQRWAKGSRLTLVRQADHLNVPKSTLANYVNPDVPDCHYPLRLLIPQTVLLNDFAVLDYLEACVGRVAFRLPEISNEFKGFRRELAATVKEFGEVLEATGTALLDNHVSSEELVLIEREVNELVRQALCFLESLKKAVRA